MDAIPFSDYSTAISCLFARLNYERLAVVPYQEPHFKLDRMRRLCGLLGHPEVHVPVVHIAGTKGKGSTSAMVASILSEAGYRTGLYTSPHLQFVEERIVIDGAPCSREAFLECLFRIWPCVMQMDQEISRDGGRGPTYFEILTAAAFEHFRRSQVDLAVIEVGLGGRLDSTNVCHSICSAITSISRDHVRQLGPTLADIAREKAGIIRPGIPVVSGVTRGLPRTAILHHARELGAPVKLLGRDFQIIREQQPVTNDPAEHYSLTYLEQEQVLLEGLHLSLLGRHQHVNAAVALAIRGVLQTQGWNIPDDSCHTGLRRARIRARVEIVDTAPLTILDAAHNDASIAALLDTLSDYWPDRERVMVVAMTRGKELSAMLQLLLPATKLLLLTQYHDNPRAVPAEELFALAKALSQREGSVATAELLVEADPMAALSAARKFAGPRDLICITGSFFLAAELVSQFPD